MNLLIKIPIVEGQPAATDTTSTTTLLQDNIDELESNAQEVAKKLRDTKGKKIPNYKRTIFWHPQSHRLTKRLSREQN
jgi:hypothetical protein